MGNLIQRQYPVGSRARTDKLAATGDGQAGCTGVNGCNNPSGPSTRTQILSGQGESVNEPASE